MLENRFTKSLVVFTLIVCMVLQFGMPRQSIVRAATPICDTYSGMNINAQNYDRWSATIKSYLVPMSDGKLMRVQYGDKIGGVLVEYYDKYYNFKSKKIITMELPIFGGFFVANDYYVLLTGQENRNQNADTKVYEVTKYDKNWNKLGTDCIKGANTTVPFDAGSARGVVYNNLLYIRTCHEMYSGHQANVSIVFNLDNNKIVDSYTDVMNTSYGYVSHSFNQFAGISDNKFVCVDHGDAYPRSILLTRYNVAASSGTVTLGYSQRCSLTDVMTFPGNTGDNVTGASVGAFEVTDSSFLIAGNSVVQDESNTSHKTRNIFVASVDKSTMQINTTWLTSFKEGETTTRTPHMIKMADNKYIVIWSRDSMVYYTTVDSTGKKLTTIRSFEGELSDCAPVIYNKKIVWYTWRNNVNTFYEISVSNLANTTVTPIENGHHYESLGVTNGYADLHCTVCGHDEHMAVPTNQSVWWNTDVNSWSYSSWVSESQKVGNYVQCWVTLEPDSGVNTDISFEPSDKSAMRIEYLSDNKAKITMLKAGTYYLAVYPTYNPGIKVNKKFVVTGPGIELNGFQISNVNKGFRTVYSIDSSIDGKAVKSSGVIYSINGVDDSQILYNSTNQDVKSIKSTTSGKLQTNYSTIGTKQSYAMTMKFGNANSTLFTTKYKVRAYAVLSDNSVKYSDVYELTIYNIADRLYKYKMMATQEGHEYLYNEILKRVKNSYSAVSYTNANYGLYN
ncbi:MAG: hypothetical protein K6G88_09980 [Lachnospiraceae bacterium]|nr:hypothetical protein [Lachnospiraceae bacterium]